MTSYDLEVALKEQVEAVAMKDLPHQEWPLHPEI